MKKYILLLSIVLMSLHLHAQFIINPKIGATFMNLTDAPDGYDYKSDIGYQFGVDFRFGKSLYIQPGLFFTNTRTTIIKDDIVEVEDDIVRQSVILKAMLGYYLLNNDDFRIRLNVGPSYDIMLSAESKDDKITVSEDEFNNGTFNLEFGGGLDITFISLDIGYQYGLSNAYDGDKVDIDSRYLGFYINAGVVINLGGDAE